MFTQCLVNTVKSNKTYQGPFCSTGFQVIKSGPDRDTRYLDSRDTIL